MSAYAPFHARPASDSLGLDAHWAQFSQESQTQDRGQGIPDTEQNETVSKELVLMSSELDIQRNDDL